MEEFSEEVEASQGMVSKHQPGKDGWGSVPCKGEQPGKNLGVFGELQESLCS